MKKRIVVALLVITISLSLYGCSGGGNTGRCTICRKTATHTFQGSGYCNTHYRDAVVWATNHLKK